MILPNLSPRAAVGVIRLRSMGDTVLATPALALLKRARPDLSVFVLLERPWDRLLAGNPDIEEVIAVAAGGGLGARLAAVRELRRRRPELCLNLHGGSTSAWLTALSGARWRAGFAHFAYGPVYNVRIPRAQEILKRPADAPVHTAEHLASAIFYLGAQQQEIPPARLYAGPPAPVRPRQPYAVLHVAAAFGSKQWPAARFAELGRWLRLSHGLEPAMLVGPGEGDLLRELREFPGFDALSVSEMMSLVEGAQMFVGNDSGPAHVAAAFGVPSVVIFGSSNRHVWHPWRTRYEVVEGPRGILSVGVEMVQRAVNEVLAARPAFQHE